ncbi:unnamed protein product [Rhizophagus irregularis]|nr:unnamed protein product [Rhizophagus irregularis]
MSYAWLALDDDNLILESSSDAVPTVFPSALRSETVALLLAIRALAPNFSVVINTDCASLISFWHKFVPTHADCPYNNQVDFLAKNSHFSPQPSVLSSSNLRVLYFLSYDSLPIDNNIRHFLTSMYDAMNLLNFSSLLRFSQLGSSDLFDWEGIYFWLFCNKEFAIHKNGQKGFLTFRLKILLDILSTLTTLQKRK